MIDLCICMYYSIFFRKTYTVKYRMDSTAKVYIYIYVLYIYTCMNVVRICTYVICRFYVDYRLVISCVSSLRNIHFLFADHRPTGHNMPSAE